MATDNSIAGTSTPLTEQIVMLLAAELILEFNSIRRGIQADATAVDSAIQELLLRRWIRVLPTGSYSLRETHEESFENV